MPTASTRRLLVVDDDPETCQLLTEILGDAGYDVLAATTGARALRLMEAKHPDLVLLDLGLSGEEGPMVGRRFKQLNPGLPLVILSGSKPVDAMTLELDIAAWLTKPCEVDELLQTIRRLGRRRRTT